MTAALFLAFSLGVVAMALVCLTYYVRHACDDLSVPDVHGDIPTIPAELDAHARDEARRRQAELDVRQFHALELRPEARN